MTESPNHEALFAVEKSETETRLMKMLLAVDNTVASDKAVQFVANLCSKAYPDGATITLFHVAESLPDFIVSRSDTGDVFRTVAKEWEAHNRADGERLLAKHKEAIASAGIEPASIHTKLAVEEAIPKAKKVVATMGIIEEMKEGAYDVVVLGRRENCSPDLPFLGSVAETVIREAQGKTVWVVD